MKIKNIRSTYLQELKKIKESKKSGGGTESVYVASVKWFRIMDDCLRNNNSEVAESQSNMPSQNGTDGENISAADTDHRAEIEFREPKPPSKNQKRTQVINMVRELKGITETVNSSVEDNEFDVFGRHISLQLKSLPLLLALEAQEHIQLHLNKIRRQYLEHSSEQSTITRTPSSRIYTSQDSPSSTASACCSDKNYFDKSPQGAESTYIPVCFTNTRVSIFYG